MKIIGSVAVAIVGGALIGTFAAPLFLTDRYAFRSALMRHASPPHRGGGKHQPFLYFTWFPSGDPKFARDGSVFDDGMLMHHRIVYNRGRTGTGSPLNEDAALPALKSLPVLPPGLPHAYAVPCRELLVMSQKKEGSWITRVYDRRRLPEVAERVLRLTHLDRRLNDTEPLYL